MMSSPVDDIGDEFDETHSHLTASLLLLLLLRALLLAAHALLTIATGLRGRGVLPTNTT